MSNCQLILLPGWGMPRDIWFPLNTSLAALFNLSYVSWEDVGAGAGFQKKGLAAVLERRDKPRILLGWSLGSLVALDIAANYPGEIAGLILIGGTSRFTIDKTGGYLAGWPGRVLERMKRNLENDWGNTLRNFYSSMFPGDENGKNEARRFLLEFGHCLFKQPLPSLQTGLDYLMEMDCRDKLQFIQAPLLLIHGGQDQICPIQASEYIGSRVSVPAVVKVLPSAGHAPFFTHPLECIGYIEDFLMDKIHGGPDD